MQPVSTLLLSNRTCDFPAYGLAGSSGTACTALGSGLSRATDAGRGPKTIPASTPSPVRAEDFARAASPSMREAAAKVIAPTSEHWIEVCEDNSHILHSKPTSVG